MKISTSAPIALFVYNRPEHTLKTLEALRLNKGSANSELYIFCDGPKTKDSKYVESVNRVRELVRNFEGFKAINIFEHKRNYGLSKSIIWGINKVFEKNNSIIVVEDDIETSPYFLNYMNDALELYANEPLVGCIHGWNFPLELDENTPDTFFLPGADCWGWATWRRAWELFEPDANKLHDQIIAKDLVFQFDRRNLENLFKILVDNINGLNDSWAIRWHASLISNGMFCLHPKLSFVNNIGFDGSGTNCTENYISQTVIRTYNKLTKERIVDAEWFYPKLNSYNYVLAKSRPKEGLLIRAKGLIYKLLVSFKIPDKLS